MAEQFHILTVCTGNVHRSPLAELLLQLWADWFLNDPVSPHVVVESAGLAAAVGEPMGSYTQRIAAALGANGSRHRARMLTDAMVTDSQLILTATVRQRDEIVARVPSALRRTFTIREAAHAAQDAGDRPHPRAADDLRVRVSELASRRAGGSTNIVDPQGLTEESYLQMAAEEVPALARIAQSLFGMPAAETTAYIQTAESPARLRALISQAADGGGTERP